MKTFNFTERRLNKEQQEAFIRAYEAKLEEVESMGWTAARDKYNLDYPLKVNNYSLNGYAYASGESEALLDSYKQD